MRRLDKAMLNVTTRAASVLARTLRAGRAEAGLGFRLVPSGVSEIALTIDQARDGDDVIRHDERTVLLMERWVSYVLDGAVLDIEEQASGTTLTLHSGNHPAAG